MKPKVKKKKKSEAAEKESGKSCSLVHADFQTNIICDFYVFLFPGNRFLYQYKSIHTRAGFLTK